MKKKILALILAAAMVFTLCACEVSSEHTATTTVTTSKTDADGNTTTQTVTNEIGITADQDGIHFLANDTTVIFEAVDQDTIINDIYNILANAHPNQAADETEEVEDAG